MGTHLEENKESPEHKLYNGKDGRLLSQDYTSGLGSNRKINANNGLGGFFCENSELITKSRCELVEDQKKNKAGPGERKLSMGKSRFGHKKGIDEEKEIRIKAGRIINYWKKKVLALPNIFKMAQEFHNEEGVRFTIESYDLSTKELLQNTMINGVGSFCDQGQDSLNSSVMDLTRRSSFMKEESIPNQITSNLGTDP